MLGIPARIGECFKVYLMLHDRATKTFSWCWPIDLMIEKKIFFFEVAQFSHMSLVFMVPLQNPSYHQSP